MEHKEAAVPAESNLPWVEKYRPKELTDLVSQENTIRTITKLIDANKLPHLLFYGPPGTGKTSAILAVAQKLHGGRGSNMVLELNASDARGIDVVRDQIKNFASNRQLFSSGFKLVILDECDAMTNTAQFALRRVIEQYTKTTRFCILCNYINKIIPALQSRCMRFRFGPLQKENIVARLQHVVKEEKMNITEKGLAAVMRLARGDMRKCLNVLQACHAAYPEVDEEQVYLCTGIPSPKDIEGMLDLLLNSSFEKAYEGMLEVQKLKGVSLVDIVTYVHETVLRMSFPPNVLAFLLDSLSNLEHRLSTGTTEKFQQVQLSSLVGMFQLARDMSVKAAV